MFANEFCAKLKHLSTDHIFTMSLFESSLMIKLLIASTEKLPFESNFPVIKGKSDDNVLPLFINEHCFPKKELKISLFSLKSAINLLSRKTG